MNTIILDSGVTGVLITITRPVRTRTGTQERSLVNAFGVIRQTRNKALEEIKSGNLQISDLNDEWVDTFMSDKPHIIASIPSDSVKFEIKCLKESLSQMCRESICQLQFVARRCNIETVPYIGIIDTTLGLDATIKIPKVGVLIGGDEEPLTLRNVIPNRQFDPDKFNYKCDKVAITRICDNYHVSVTWFIIPRKTKG